MRYAVQKVPFISMSFGRPFGNARQLLNSNTRNTREKLFYSTQPRIFKYQLFILLILKGVDYYIEMKFQLNYY
jgi:hypothetical protein